MINKAIGITPPALGRTARLRADRIRRDTLTMLAAALREDHDGSLQNALDALVDAIESPHDTEGAEIDALCADIEDLADMGRADMPLTSADVEQLAGQAEEALDAMRPAAERAPVAVREARAA